MTNTLKKSNSLPRPKRKPKPFARWAWSYDKAGNKTMVYNCRAVDFGDVVDLLNDLGVVLKGKP